MTERERVRTCSSGKACYPSRSEALAFSKRYGRATGGKRPGVYCCPMCGRWHVTSHGQSTPDARKRKRVKREQNRRGEWLEA